MKIKIFYIVGLFPFLAADNCNENREQLQQLQLLQDNYGQCSRIVELEKEMSELRTRLVKAERRRFVGGCKVFVGLAKYWAVTFFRFLPEKYKQK